MKLRFKVELWGAGGRWGERLSVIVCHSEGWVPHRVRNQ